MKKNLLSMQIFKSIDAFKYTPFFMIEKNK